eukprot:m.22164 g.22164  ORF g.22164 m.22164 type:complete len:57 (+) comp12638_c0_seq1:3782-3952(+)
MKQSPATVCNFNTTEHSGGKELSHSHRNLVSIVSSPAARLLVIISVSGFPTSSRKS